MRKRFGTVLITVLIIFVLVFMIGMGFNRFSSSIRRQTNRTGEASLVELTVQGLAIAAFHKIQFDLLSDDPSDGGRMKKALASPKPYLKETAYVLDRGNSGFAQLAEELAKPLKELGNLKYTIYYQVDDKDFISDLSARDAREKEGFIRLRIVTSYKKIDDEFLFACKVKVTSAWIPLLSKFNLFIENPESDIDKWRFNIVRTKPDGDRIAGSAKPIVLDNGTRLSGKGMMDLNTYLQSRVGWVFFGGNAPTVLNLAQGTNEFGEFFHLYETWDTALAQFVGFYETAYFNYSHNGISGLVATVQWDKGIADEIGAGAYPAHWFNIIKGTPDELRMTRNSVFRLYGTDKQQTPTIVLGKVFRGMISARGYQTSPKGLIQAELFQWVPANQWPEYISYDSSIAGRNGLASIATAARKILGLDEGDLNVYREKYASQATQQGYNASLAFIATNRTTADPYKNFSGWFAKVMQANRDIGEMAQLPVNLGGYKAGTQIPALNSILQGLPAKACFSIDIDQALAEINKKGALQASLLDILALRGIYRKSSSTLDPDGWIIIKSRSKVKLVVDQPIKVVSNGGIILEQGDILIANDIDAGNYQNKPGDERNNTPAHALQLVALNGNIAAGACKIDAALIANGNVLFLKEKPVIRGAVATKWFDIANASAGADLYYNQNLALEATAQPDHLELLAFKLNPTPVYLK
ncbi:MAG: hypothetical protein CVV41_02990 [Candidatus Riflebacteria bacterium HGW-Riflebacteria-1]|nr:MAG: hypothetical protein CVV41_02990 [Candidatus Riflebacteria bacterium HGW-Riflebacteria-1]